MTKLPKSLEQKVQKVVKYYKDESCWNEANAYEAGFNSGALEVKAAADKLAEALKSIAQNQIGPPYEYSCEEMQAEAIEALAEWQKLWEEK